MAQGDSKRAKANIGARSVPHRDLIADGLDSVDADQIAERLSWTPSQRLRYLLDMLDFEDRARHARRIS
jgi:hypothetical protein